ncbi:SRPBCC domain-containing protein [Arthrobacter jiangjiafuii]|uniref:SRPBCC domain-containing protein n=1 Tax=Arthrobacter jiangjiafuii TaxID=2817475 RepID=A0A975M7Q5_9MICC|nr:SRPBCC domain-containing protein [Arthrobacter jiangjiafuii]MBP3044358.1 SRPBCC domain-containing protein [Arthrobacter jiangjiafuii]QWC11309.1 SRPBCC domain-containing protein [Arthrobacter jiangjiafuii]
MPNAASIETIYSTTLACPAEDVWRALTSSNVQRSWMWDSRLRGSMEPGSDYALYDDGGNNLIVGTVQEAEAPYRLVLTFDARWDERVAEEPAGTLEYLITPTGDRDCVFSVRLYGLSGATADAVERDTVEIYDGLKAWLEENDGA